MQCKQAYATSDSTRSVFFSLNDPWKAAACFIFRNADFSFPIKNLAIG